MHTHTLDMTTGSPVRLLLRFSLPLFIGNLLQQIYNLSDTAIAGHLLGDAALSQIGATAALYSLITTLAFGLNSGFALSVSRYFIFFIRVLISDVFKIAFCFCYIVKAV